MSMDDYWVYFFSSIALLFVFEGMLPFLSPQQWRKMMMQLAQQSNQTLRVFGAVSMGLGLLLLMITHSGYLG